MPFSWAPSALLQLSSGMGTPVVPHRSSTVLPRMVFTLATDVWTTGLWHFLSSTWLKRTPARLRGVKHFSLGSMNAMLGDWKFRKWTISYRLQSHTQGLSCKPVKINQSTKSLQLHLLLLLLLFLFFSRMNCNRLLICPARTACACAGTWGGGGGGSWSCPTAVGWAWWIP